MQFFQLVAIGLLLLVSLIQGQGSSTFTSPDGKATVMTVQNSGFNTITVTMTVSGMTAGANWIGTGVSASGGMVNSDIVVGWIPAGGGTGVVKQYYTTAYAAPTAASGTTITSASITVSNGNWVLVYTRPIMSAGSNSNAVSATLENTFVWGYGPLNAGSLGKHTSKGTFKVNYSQSGTGNGLASGAPTTSFSTPDNKFQFTAVYNKADSTVTISATANSVASLANTYVAVGVSASGQMPNSDLVIGYFPDASLASPSINQYYTTDYVKPTQAATNANMQSPSFKSTGANTLVLTFTRKLAATGANSNPVNLDSKTSFVYAVGNIVGGQITKHALTSRAPFELTLSSTGSGSAGGGDNTLLKKIHGILMVLAWGIIIPNGIALARFGKVAYPTWYKMHRNGQLTGVLFSMVGLALIVAQFKGTLRSDDPHFIIGYVVFFLSIIEVLLGFYSNFMWKEGKEPSFVDDKLHWYNGRTVALLSLANIGLGVYVYSQNYSHLLIGLFGALILVLILLNVYLQTFVGQKHEYLSSNLHSSGVELTNMDGHHQRDRNSGRAGFGKALPVVVFGLVGLKALVAVVMCVFIGLSNLS